MIRPLFAAAFYRIVAMLLIVAGLFTATMLVDGNLLDVELKHTDPVPDPTASFFYCCFSLYWSIRNEHLVPPLFNCRSKGIAWQSLFSELFVPFVSKGLANLTTHTSVN